ERIKERFSQKTGASGGSSNPAAISHQGHARQLADFVRAIQTGGEPLVDGREGRKAVAIIEAIYKSARTEQTTTPYGGPSAARPTLQESTEGRNGRETITSTGFPGLPRGADGGVRLADAAVRPGDGPGERPGVADVQGGPPTPPRGR